MHAVVTLVERDFLFGAAVLYNSLVRHGFDQQFIIGHRKTTGMPRAILDAMTSGAGLACPVEFVEIETDHHFANFKPKFMSRVLESRPEIERITYIDPDIVVGCPWSWMQTWCQNGPVAFGDINWRMPENHPLRYQWRDILTSGGLSQKQALSVYYNSGFSSVERKDSDFLALWSAILDQAKSLRARLVAEGDIGSWKDGGRDNPLQIPDQDTFNMALTAWERELVTFGPDAMGFASGHTILPHAVGAGKPWRKNYLIEALRGRPPRFVDKRFWDNALGVIPIASNASVQSTRAAIYLASAVGRFYRRS